MLYYVVGLLNRKLNVLILEVFSKGQLLGHYEIPIVGLEFRNRHPAVRASACHGIIKNKLIEWTTAEVIPHDWPFFSEGTVLEPKFTPENTRITVKEE